MKKAELKLDYAKQSANILARLRNFLQSFHASSGNYDTISMLIDEMESHAVLIADSKQLAIWQTSITGLMVLKSYMNCRHFAKTRAGDIVAEREMLTVLCDELKECLQNMGCGDELTNGLFKEHSVDAEKLATFLKELPIPVVYWINEIVTSPVYRKAQQDSATAPAPLVRIIALIDEDPLASPQLLHPQILYSIKFIVRGINWLEGASKLRIDLMTTLPASEYSVSDFTINKPDRIDGFNYEGEMAGYIQFRSAQSLLSGNLSLVIRCAFELADGSYTEIPAIGHSQLEFKIINPNNPGFAVGYRRLSQPVADIVERLLKDGSHIKCELDDLLPMLEALANLLGVYAQGAVFKEREFLSEKEFQEKVLNDLRIRLGEDVQEHTRQAGGFTDIRYRGVIVELKVERNNGDRDSIAKKYTKQSTQYEGVEGRQVSIVLVLDLTPKTNPPGDIRNDIILCDVETHGGPDMIKEYPSKAVVFVVNGNWRNPSDYS